MTESAIKRVLSITSKTPTEIAKIINTTPQTINNWKNRGISKEGAQAIAQAFNMSIDWILTGKGAPYISTTDNIPNYRQISDWDSDTPLDSDEVAIVFYKSLEFACGDGKCGEVYHGESRRLRFSRHTLNNLNIQPSNAFAATARDDSMKTLIEDGDTIFVDTGNRIIKDGKVYAIEHGGLFRCKRLYNMPNGGVRIVSDNHDEFPEFVLDAQQIQDEGFIVLGAVFSVSKLL